MRTHRWRCRPTPAKSQPRMTDERERESDTARHEQSDPLRRRPRPHERCNSRELSTSSVHHSEHLLGRELAPRRARGGTSPSLPAGVGLRLRVLRGRRLHRRGGGAGGDRLPRRLGWPASPPRVGRLSRPTRADPPEGSYPRAGAGARAVCSVTPPPTSQARGLVDTPGSIAPSRVPDAAAPTGTNICPCRYLCNGSMTQHKHSTG